MKHNQQNKKYDDPPIIALPYLLMNDEFLIHELNHVLTTEIPILLENDNKSGYIEKLGIEAINCIDKIVHTANEKELIFEEVLNERSALDITEIFHQLGGSIYDDANSFDIKMKAFYRDLIPLIEPFYQQYKEIIKEARITSNANILYKYINKDVFNELKDLIGKIFKKIYNDNGNITDDDIENVTRLVELLPRDYFEEIDNNTYITELESKGYKVKKLT